MSAVVNERLPGVLGHELRNPLASAVTGAMLARDLVDEGDPRATVLDGVMRDLDRMTGLIDGWLALARNETPTLEALDLEVLLHGITTRHRAELLSCPPSVCVQGNRVMLERAIDNLCENARRAGATNVRLAAQQDGETVTVHVEDDGKGVSAEEAEHVFDAGWSHSGSTGLGLFSVATTLQACSGSIRCVPLSDGTRFTVRLMRAEPQPL